MKDRVALMCKNPALIEMAQNQNAESFSMFSAYRKSLLLKLGVLELWEMISPTYYWIGGYYATDEQPEPKEGFKEHPELDQIMIPDQSTKIGEEWSDRLMKSAVKLQTWPGLPQVVILEEGVANFHLQKFDGVWYATLKSMAPAHVLAEIDWNIWEPVKINDFQILKDEHGWG